MTYDSEVLADSPWGYWKCDEASGTTFTDSSGNSRDLTLTGTPTGYQQNTSGILTGVTYPSGSSVSAQNTSATTALAGSSPVTLECWVYLTANPASTINVVAMRTPSDSGGVVIQILSTGKANFSVTNSGNSSASSTASLNLNAWNHIVGVSPGTGVLYVRLNKVTTTGATRTTAQSGASPRIHRVGGTISTVGPITIGPWAYYESQLADARIDAHYDAAFSSFAASGPGSMSLSGTVGASAGSGSVTGSVTASASVGASAGSGSVTGSVTASASATASVSVASGITGSLDLSGSAATGPITGALTPSLAVTGTAGGTGGSGATTGSLSIAGTAGGTGASGSIAGSLSIAGTAAVTAGASGSIAGSLSIAGTAAIFSGGGGGGVGLPLNIDGTTQAATWSIGLGAPDEYAMADLVILDPDLTRAPTSVQIIIYDCGTSEDLVISIDGIDVFEVSADVNGYVAQTSIPIDETTGLTLNAGTHTLTATGTVSLASQDFTLANDPDTHLIVQGPDADPVEIPEATATPTRRWVLQDLLPGGLGSWAMPINPTSADWPGTSKTTTTSRSTANAGVLYVTEGGYIGFPVNVTGYCPNQEFYEQMQAYAALERRIYLIDDQNRAWTVAITSFDPKLRKRQVENDGSWQDWAADYTLSMWLFRNTYKTPVSP